MIVRENLPSIRLFAQNGFRTVGFRERIAYTPDGLWHDTLVLEYRSRSVDWAVPLAGSDKTKTE